MRTLVNPKRNEWAGLCRRPAIELDFLESTVKNILHRVRTSGDLALKEFGERFDGVRQNSFLLSESEKSQALKKVDPLLRNAIDAAARNITKFHSEQQREFGRIETMPGVSCWRKAVPIEKVGIYVPGGTAPLFSTALMLAIPARIAGCAEVILCTPPDKQGNVAPAIVYAASIANVTTIFKCGGAQAIGAMAYGTMSVPPVHKIFGPGNQYVTMAKQMVSQEGVAIDLPAGPSEVMVIADESAQPEYVASDLLAQAEHGTDSQVVLLAPSERKISEVRNCIESQLAALPRKELARGALANSLAIVFEDAHDTIDFVNAYAPEHLIINTIDPDEIADQVRNAGSVFLGKWSPESAGDYASGTNHTLPTNGYAKAHGGVSLESFQKIITFQEITREGLKLLGPIVEKMAEAEELLGHRNSISIRLKDLS